MKKWNRFFSRVLACNKLDFIITAGILLFGFIIFMKLFRPGLVAFEDNPPHFIEAWSLANYIIPNKLGISAWVNYDFAGFPIFMYHPYPLGFFIIYVLQLIPWVSLSLAYKLVMYLSYVLPAICFFLVMKRKVGIDFALTSAVLWLFNLYALDLVVQGMWSISLSMAPFILLINELYTLPCEKVYNVKYAIQKIMKIAILVASILLLHSYTFFVSIMIICLYILLLIVERPTINLKKFNIYLLISAVILAFVFDSYYILSLSKSLYWPSSVFVGAGFIGGLFHLIFPYHLGLRTIYNLIIDYNYIYAIIIFFKHLLVNIPNYFMLIFGILGIWYNKNKLFTKVLIITLIILLFVVTGIFNFLNNFPIIKFLIMPRFLIHIQTIILFYVSIGFYQTFLNKETFQCSSIGAKLKSIQKPFVLKILITLIMVSFIISAGTAFSDVEKNMYLTKDYPEFNHLLEVFNWIETTVDEPTRIYYQSTWDSSKNSGINQSWIMAYANYYTTKPSLGTWSGMMPYPTYNNLKTYCEDEEVIFGKSVTNLTDEQLSFYLKSYNSKYIVINSNNMRILLKNSSLFTMEKSFGRFTIYSLNNFNPSYIQPTNYDSSITNLKFENELIEFDAFNVESINISVQYHPCWKAYIDGKQIKIRKNELNLMQFEIPDGRNEIHHISVRFEK